MADTHADREADARAGIDGHTHEHACLNCRTHLAGDYCHACGQAAHVHRTIVALLHDIGHGVFHFEGKIWGTLPLLLWRPGELTRRYVAGERTRFVSPLALFLFGVFLMFATFSAIGGPFSASREGGVRADQARLARDLSAAEARLTTLQARPGADADALEAARERVRELRSANRFTDTLVGKPDRDKVSLNSGIGWLDQGVAHAAENPGLAAYKLQSSAYKFSWALIPISLPFIWLLFAFRRDVGPYDHAIFAVYSLSAVTLLVVLLSLLAAIGLSPGLAFLALVVLPPVHMYRQLRGAYAIGRFAALWRTAALMLFALAAGLIFLALIFAKDFHG